MELKSEGLETLINSVQNVIALGSIGAKRQNPHQDLKKMRIMSQIATRNYIRQVKNTKAKFEARKAQIDTLKPLLDTLGRMHTGPSESEKSIRTSIKEMRNAMKGVEEEVLTLEKDAKRKMPVVQLFETFKLKTQFDLQKVFGAGVASLEAIEEILQEDGARGQDGKFVKAYLSKRFVEEGKDLEGGDLRLDLLA